MCRGKKERRTAARHHVMGHSNYWGAAWSYKASCKRKDWTAAAVERSSIWLALRTESQRRSPPSHTHTHLGRQAGCLPRPHVHLRTVLGQLRRLPGQLPLLLQQLLLQALRGG